MESVLNSQLGLKMLSLMVGFVSVHKVSVTQDKSSRECGHLTRIDRLVSLLLNISEGFKKLNTAMKLSPIRNKYGFLCCSVYVI